jgi:tetratricopeptide (TPR) repeat protein
VDKESFDATMRRADKFAAELAAGRSSPWIALRILQAESLIVQGNYQLAFEALPPGMRGHTASDVRANLVAAEAQLRMGNIPEAQRYAGLANAGAPEHPVALRLWGAAYLEGDLATADPTRGGAVEALRHLDRAVSLVSDYVEARFERARALLLVADRSAMNSRHARECRLIAIADLAFVLERFPTLKQAATLRDHLQAHLNVDAAPKGATK